MERRTKTDQASSGNADQYGQENKGHTRTTGYESGYDGIGHSSKAMRKNAATKTKEPESARSTRGSKGLAHVAESSKAVFRHDVFATEADYDASVAYVMEQINKGRAKPRTPDEE